MSVGHDVLQANSVISLFMHIYATLLQLRINWHASLRICAYFVLTLFMWIALFLSFDFFYLDDFFFHYLTLFDTTNLV